jgi:hypothetical protein
MDFDKMAADATLYILKHHISLGSYVSPDGNQLGPPSGSGTLVSFEVDGKRAYGILTAAHVARWTPIIKKNGENQEWIGLMKPSENQGCACLCTFRFQYFSVSIAHFHEQTGIAYRPDLAFILLGIDEYPKHELFEKSEFYDMDNDISFLVEEDPQVFSGFFRGACMEKEIKDGFLNTPICFGGGEKIRFDARAFVQYWEIPNTSGQTMRGGSGAAFWQFRCNENGDLIKSLAGVITAESTGCDLIEAIAASYIFDDFLPNLKKQVRNELSLNFSSKTSESLQKS